MVCRLARKENLFSVRSPSRILVLEGMIRDFGQHSARSWNHPDVGVVAIVKQLSCTIRHKGYTRAVRRPLRISIVPVLAVRDLLRLPVRNTHDPQMLALVVIPSGVIEFILDMRV